MSIKGKTLVLFDIDGTLIRAGPSDHKRALIEAMDSVYSVDSKSAFESLKLDGMVDNEIVIETLGKLGIGREKVLLKLARTIALSERIFLRIRLKRRQVLPGVRAALRKFKKVSKLAFLTGNPKRIAFGKMETVGIANYFSRSQGAFGNEGFDRKEIARVALKKAREAGFGKIFLVGDTPKDIAAAKEIGAVAVAVSTGRIGKEELRKHSPEILLANLRDFPFTLLGRN